ncbi:MAG: choice-of-anchor Q domain-containing protein [Anaerolineales bacterium]|jgi:hypothetical protein|nr:choice-of-anchor Q domain-containing protein [Anaerolineales bacterium]GER78438.1 conserved hypothetical protein [Candidatus Denitrolinea symbiosum]
MKLIRPFLVIWLAVGLLAAFPVRSVHADTIGVSNCDDSGAGSLRQAIADANSGDTINFSVDCPASAPITLASSLIISKAITVSGAGRDVVISGNNAVRILETLGADVALEYLTLKEASVSDGGNGGAIYDSGNHLTISHVTFEGNVVSNAGDGGAIYHYLNGSLAIQNSVFLGNSADLGGAIFSMANTTVADTTFSNNKAFRGGAYTNYSGTTATFERVTMSGNTATGPGSTFGQGGAIYFGFGTLNIYNSAISGNGSASYTNAGGALYVYDANVTIKNSAIADNLMDTSDPGYHGGGMLINNSTLSLFNSILANNAKDDCYTEEGLTIAQNVNNLVEVSVGCGTPSLTADPNLGPLADNGGPTWTRALLPGSPAIDAGDASSCLATDQRGIIRPQGVRCDIGSFELEQYSRTFRSAGAQDGWVLESSETSNKGGTFNSAATAFRLGDDAARKQYRAILSFNTSSLPDNAVITKVTLKVKRQGVTGGGNPVNAFQGFMADVKKGMFGTSALQAADFQTAANKTVGPLKPPLVGGWYSLNLTGAGNFVNKLATAGGITQVRLRFKLDDNNNAVANYLSLFSGNAPFASRPQLIVEYYIP